MSQCVPSWDLVDQSVYHERPSLRSHSSSTAPNVPLLDYEVAELTWENGQVAMHGFGVPRLSMKPASSNVPAKYTWDKPRASGTLESIVNQATHAPPRSKASFNGGAKNEDLVPWFDNRGSGSTSATIAMDALVPCSNRAEGPVAHVIDTSLAGCSIDRVGSCSVAGGKDDAVFVPVKRAKVARVPSPQDWSSRDQSVTGSDTIEKDSQHLSLDTYDDDLGAGFTSTSPENTISERRCSKSTTVDDYNSICHSRPQRFAGDDDVKKKRNRKVSIKRSRAAAVHNQSERKRRDKINQKMKTLQKLVPNSSKTDKASMLDEVIEYLKQLQAQVQMMRMHTPAMMLPPPLPAMTAMQQQLQMSMLQASMGLGPMMGAMGMGMGMGMGVDMNSIGRANISSIPPVLHPAAPFVFVNPWDGSGDRLQAASSGLMPDPLSAFLPCQSPPINMEAYCRLAAMYQQFQQPPMSSSKN